MLQIHTTQRLDQIEVGLRMAAERHGGRILAVSHVGQLLQTEMDLEGSGRDRLHDVLPGPVCSAAARGHPFRGVSAQPDRGLRDRRRRFLETIPPREYCRLLHRPEVEPLAAALEDTLRLVMEEAAHGVHAKRRRAGSRRSSSTEEQINMRAALPQRIDCHGTKVEELAGTGVHDTQGG